MELVWDEIEKRTYETGVDHGVLYLPNPQGAYVDGVAWNGLVSVTESPSGAEPNAQYADNIKYLNLRSAEEFMATLEAFTYPDEFAQFDGLGSPSPGVTVGQQPRRSFGLSYRTKKGNAVEGDDFGYKLHLVYGCSANPSEKAYSTVNDSPEPVTFSWEITTVPVGITAVADMKPTSIIVVDSSEVDPTTLAALEDLLYGTAGTEPSLPTPDTVLTMFEGGVTLVTPQVPAYDSPTDTITIPNQVGVSYFIGGVEQAAGPVVITEDTIVTAVADAGYDFPDNVDDDWFYNHV